MKKCPLIHMPGQARHRFLTPGVMVLFSLWTAILCTAAPAPETDHAAGRHTTVPYPPHTQNLTRVQCMQCHPLVADLLRTGGGKHARIDCRQCHRRYHVYIVGKTKYEDILPKCESCHPHPKGHGEELTNCRGCHQEGHTPRRIPSSTHLEQGCDTCHQQPSHDIKTFVTKHSELYCSACHHTRHGTIPDCLECHQPHTGTVPQAGELAAQEDSPLGHCTGCHPPHNALGVQYPDSTDNSVCAFCHRHAQDMLSQSGTRHADLHCITCHPNRHKTIKRCEECHGRPHPDAMMKHNPRFNSCGGCHGVAHNVIR